MAVAPAIFLAEVLVDHLQSCCVEPVSDPVTAAVVVVAPYLTIDDLAAHHAEPAAGERGECFLITGSATSSTVR